MYCSQSTTTLRRSATLMTESFTVSLFVYLHSNQAFCVLFLPLCECLYSEKDVGGGLCHCHISHLVQPKTLICRKTRTPKIMTEKSGEDFLQRASDSQFFLPVSDFFSYVTSST